LIGGPWIFFSDAMHNLHIWPKKIRRVAYMLQNNAKTARSMKQLARLNFSQCCHNQHAA